MKTLRETYGSEVAGTKDLASKINELNKVNQLCGLPNIVKASSEEIVKGGRIDIVGYTQRGDVILYEHQDLSGRADQTHVDKTIGYPTKFKIENSNIKVIASILLCEEIDEVFLRQIEEERKQFVRRKYNGHKNLHVVKSQWTEDGIYTPCLFEENDIIKIEEKRPIEKFKSFVKVYGSGWSNLAEQDQNTRVTLWHSSEFSSRHYIHLLSSGKVEIGVHFDFDNPKQTKELILSHPNGSPSKGEKRYSIKITLGKDSTHYDWWLESEKLKQHLIKEAI